MSTPNQKVKGSSGLYLTAIYLAAMVLLFIGERLVLESTGVRIGLAAVAELGILFAIIMRLRRASKLGPLAKPVERRLLFLYLGGAIALLLYLGQADFVMDRLRPMFSEPKGAERYEVILGTLWPIVWIASVLPILLVEAAYAPVDVHRTVEFSRIRRSLQSGAVVAITAALLATVNYIGSEFNKKADLSYFKTTKPSESSRKMVANLSGEMKATLFFPGANEVQDEVTSYFEDLGSVSKNFKIKTVDHAMEPKLASDLSARENGSVVLSRGKQNESIFIGLKLAQAKSRLRKLDGEFQAAFFKLAKGEKIAYLTVGHEERTQEERDKKRGSSIGDMRAVLTQLNYQIKDLGIGQGLASEVPKDARVVIIAGPRKAFLDSEAQAIVRYLQGGGRALMFLDPEAGETWEPVLSPFGLKFTPEPLANDRYFARATYTPADRQFIFSNSFSSHPSVNTLSNNSNRLAAVMLGAGALSEIPPTGKGTKKPQVQFTVHSMPLTWNDKNSNYTFDAAAKEERKIYELAAVVTMPADGTAKKNTDKNDKDDKAKAKADEGDDEMRLIVIADSDIVSDKAFRNPGNTYLFADAVKWLGGQEKYIGETTSEEDVRISHTRKEDQVWFFLTIFAAPLLVLGLGVFYTRRLRRRK